VSKPTQSLGFNIIY